MPAHHPEVLALVRVHDFNNVLAVILAHAHDLTERDVDALPWVRPPRLRIR